MLVVFGSVIVMPGMIWSRLGRRDGLGVARAQEEIAREVEHDIRAREEPVVVALRVRAAVDVLQARGVGRIELRRCGSGRPLAPRMRLPLASF